jgi:hypothetical protein
MRTPLQLPGVLRISIGLAAFFLLSVVGMLAAAGLVFVMIFGITVRLFQILKFCSSTGRKLAKNRRQKCL